MSCWTRCWTTATRRWGTLLLLLAAMLLFAAAARQVGGQHGGRRVQMHKLVAGAAVTAAPGALFSNSLTAVLRCTALCFTVVLCMLRRAVLHR